MLSGFWAKKIDILPICIQNPVFVTLTSLKRYCDANEGLIVLSWYQWKEKTHTYNTAVPKYTKNRRLYSKKKKTKTKTKEWWYTPQSPAPILVDVLQKWLMFSLQTYTLHPQSSSMKNTHQTIFFLTRDLV